MSGLIVVTTDDLEPAVRLRASFVAAGYDVELLTASEKLRDLATEPVLLILTGGIHEPRAERLMSEARQYRRLPIIALFEPEEHPHRERCRALGLQLCFTKPIDLEELTLVARRTIERERLREITGIVGETEVMDEVLERVVQIAAVDSTVLIQGESGTGKELIARGLHALSSRRHRPFIGVNVAALTETLLESELFGHEKGAFTGAASLRKGLFELAQGGAIFLDEIGEMPAATQTKLLRVLEEREFRRVGGEELLRVDVRVIAATNRHLREQVELGEFRRDLYHRLNVLRIDLPPLRERREDVPLLITQFVRELSSQHDRTFPGIDPDALRILVEYDWPGNVRELRNLIESMVVLAHGSRIRPEDIPAEVRGAGHRNRFLPVLARQNRPDESVAGAPEWEFILRTIFELRVDLDELRREMERLRSRERRELELPAFPPSFANFTEPAPELTRGPEAPTEPEGVIVYRPGMTMNDLEREAIAAALQHVEGNRRRAAEMLGIGERTLYRKIREYELEE